MRTKQIEDLPADALIELRRLFEDEIKIEAINAENSPYYKPCRERRLLGLRLKILQSPNTGQNFLRVENTEAEDGFGPLGLACSPNPDPGGMRVFRAQMGKEILDETDATQSGADHQEAA